MVEEAAAGQPGAVREVKVEKLLYQELCSGSAGADVAACRAGPDSPHRDVARGGGPGGLLHQRGGDRSAVPHGRLGPTWQRRIEIKFNVKFFL